MTWREKLQEENPNLACGLGGGFGCPHMHFKEATKPVYCDCGKACDRCWSRTIPETKPSDEVKACTNCKYLSRDADEEPCKSCNAIGRNPSNWVYRDNSDLEYNSETDRWEPRFDSLDISTWYPHSMIMGGRSNGKTIKTMMEIQKVYDRLVADLYKPATRNTTEERKTDMPTRSPYSPYQMFGNVTVSAPLPEIEDVIFNPPATIVFWKDKTKTVVKANNEEYDPEKGLAMAMIKKLYGNKGRYCNKLKKWTDKYYGKYPGDKAEELRKDIHIAYDLLTTIRDSKKMTKSQMICEIEDAIAYLGEALED